MNLSYGNFLLFGIFLASYVLWNPVFAQLPSATGIGVIINTPADSANLPTGDLTIHGTSSDSNTTDCQVFADWNDLKPMQNVTANGPKGISDYSKWSFTYTSGYHGIVEGPNELTSKITCFDQGQNASSKSYSINVTGIGATSEITNNITQKSSEIADTEDLGVKDTNIMPANSDTSNTDSTNNTVQSTEDVGVEVVGSEDVANESTDILPANDNKNNGTYKILPLYSESDEESADSASFDDTDQSDITNMNTFESQNGFTSGDTDSETYSTFNSEQQETIGETNNLDMTEASDEGLTSLTESNTFFTYEPDLVEDTSNPDELTTYGTSPQSENSFTNHEIDDTSIFGLKFNGPDDVTQNKIEKRIEKLEDRISDRMSLFDLIG
ncbi:MAG TPA: hypothetical protein VJ599_02050 [Nitrososphaeraceae archaeon]|nr:hypothetical protein [Nitrososphaeraceae archaeon]